MLQKKDKLDAKFVPLHIVEPYDFGLSLHACQVLSTRPR